MNSMWFFIFEIFVKFAKIMILIVLVI